MYGQNDLWQRQQKRTKINKLHRIAASVVLVSFGIIRVSLICLLCGLHISGFYLYSSRSLNHSILSRLYLKSIHSLSKADCGAFCSLAHLVIFIRIYRMQALIQLIWLQGSKVCSLKILWWTGFSPILSIFSYIQFYWHGIFKNLEANLQIIAIYFFYWFLAFPSIYFQRSWSEHWDNLLILQPSLVATRFLRNILRFNNQKIDIKTDMKTDVMENLKN